MDNQSSLSKQKGKNSVRQMWSHDEDQALLDIIKGHCRQKWNIVADELKKRLSGTTKTGKQCRERFRNYLDPNITRREWTKSDKIVFLVLHKQYGNHWGQITKYYIGRSDISLKNLFYSYIRRALKNIKNGIIPPSIITKPKKFFELCYIIDVINTKYLPVLEDSAINYMEENHEKILLNLIKEKQVTRTNAIEYKASLTAAFKEGNPTASFPLPLWVSIEGLNLADSQGAILKSIISEQSFGEVSQLIAIKLIDGSGTTQPVNKPAGLASSGLPSLLPITIPMKSAIIASHLPSTCVPSISSPIEASTAIKNLPRQASSIPITSPMDPSFMAGSASNAAFFARAPSLETMVFNAQPHMPMVSPQSLYHVYPPSTSSHYQPTMSSVQPFYQPYAPPRLPQMQPPLSDQRQKVFIWPLVCPVDMMMMPNMGMQLTQSQVADPRLQTGLQSYEPPTKDKGMSKSNRRSGSNI